MKSLREYMDIISSLEELDEAKPERMPSPVTTTKYDKDGNPVSQTTEPPRWEEKRAYIAYKVPHDWQLKRKDDPSLPDPRDLGLKYMSNSGKGKNYSLYRTLDNNKNNQAELVFGPGQEIVITVKPGTPWHRFYVPPPAAPNTEYWKKRKARPK